MIADEQTSSVDEKYRFGATNTLIDSSNKVPFDTANALGDTALVQAEPRL